MENSVDDWSWGAEVAYACACGAYGPVTRWRWVDADARPELAKRLREAGPLEGTCRACQRPAEGAGAWLELSPGKEQATLVLAAHQRGELLEALQAHLEQLRARPTQVRHWLVQPRVAFAPPRTPAVAATDGQERGPGVPKAVGQRGWASGPALAIEVQRALVCDLSLEEGVVAVVAVLDEPTRRMWGSAALQARPVLLRGLGYPLLGVRLVASYLGEVAVIDAVVDVGEPRTSEIFMRLAQSFRLQLFVRGDAGQASAVREIEAESLRRNAAMCLESAQGQLGAGEFPQDAYRSARDALARMNAKQRLEPARQALVEGSYRHLVSPAEALHALDRLDQASRKDNLARLLEVDGLPVGEYEAIRKAVLAAALEFGLTAPARFWRRILGTELVHDAGDWIQKLTAHRSAWIARGDDLTPEQAEQAWRGIFDLCTHHNITPPPEVVQALGLGRRGEAARPGLHVVNEAPRPPSASARVVASDDPRPASAPTRAATPVESRRSDTVIEPRRPGSGPARAATPIEPRRPGSGPVRAATPIEPRRPGSGPVRAATPIERPPTERLTSERAGEPRAGEPRAGEPRAGEPRRAGSEPTRAASTDLRPGEHRPGEPRSLEPRPGEHRPGDARHGEPRSLEPRPGEYRPGDTRPGEPRSIEPRSIEPRRPSAPVPGPSAEPPRAPATLPPPRRGLQPTLSGEIGAGEIASPARAGGTARAPESRASDTQRVARALEILGGGGPPGEAMTLLAEFEEDDLLTLLPALAELGTRIVPDLLGLLESPRRPQRQAAAILLGLARDRRALDPLAAQLGAETSAVWIDVAKALGNFGPRVVGPLCALLRGAPADRREALVNRVGRAFAELVVSDGDAPGGAGRLAVENLLEVADPSVSSAARRALATLADVQGEGRGAGGGSEDRNERDVRRFSTRAYEAITTPELDADGDIEVVGDD